MSADTLEVVELDEAPALDDSKLAHIVNCPLDKESTEAWITEARVFGLLVRALCGHEWVPESNPEKHPICDRCLAEAERITREVNGG